MTEYRPVAVSTVSSRSDMTAASAAGSRDSPLAVGTSPSATAARLVRLDQQRHRAGHALGHLGHVRRRALGQGTGQVSDRTGVGEHGIERAGQLDGGGQGPGPAQADLVAPRDPANTSSIASRSADIMLCAARIDRPGALGYPPAAAGVVCTGMSISRAAVRPTRSAPGPRAGSSSR